MNLKALTSVSGIEDFAKAIGKRFDKDGNGQLSMTEFADVMKTLLGGAAAPTFPPASAVATPTPTTPAPTVDRPQVGSMAGFDPTKLADESRTTTKYQIGRILQYYPNTPQGLKDALPEIQRLVPGAKITGTNGDKLDFGAYTDASGTRIGVIDVLQGASAGGRAWQWLPVS